MLNMYMFNAGLGLVPGYISTKTYTLNPRRIHKIYVDYANKHLFTKYLHESHVGTFHVDEIHVGPISIFRG